MKYQLVALGPAAAAHLPDLRTELDARIRDLGLDPVQDFELLDAEHFGQIDWDGIPVGVWFGDKTATDSSHLVALRELLDCDCVVFPVVEKLQDYRDQMPSELYPVNGHEWAPARLIPDLLRAFQLTRAKRQAFISYKRNESSRVAVQVFDALSRRG